MQLFISYAHVDNYRVRELVDILRQGGHEPWLDSALLAGQEWQAKLFEAIEKADAFIYVLTPESVEAKWCLIEFEHAAKLGKPIIPVLMQANTVIPPSIKKRYQYVNFSNGPTSEAVAKLMGGLAEIRANSTSQQHFANSHPPMEPTPAQTRSIPKLLGRPWWQGVSAIIAIITLIVAIIALPQLQQPSSSPTPGATNLQYTATALAQIDATRAQQTESATLVQNTEAPAQTTAPITNAPPTSTSVPPTPSTGSPASLIIYRDEDSFTLYVPQSSTPLSLVGLEFQVTLLDGSTIERRLDRDFAAFAGMPFSSIDSLNQAICFRLLRSGANVPTPQDCQSGVLLLTQNVAEADVFWYNRDTGTGHTVLIYRDDQLMGACGPQASCVVNWREVTPTPGYPCDATIQASNEGEILRVVRLAASINAQLTLSVKAGDPVILTELPTQRDGITWFRVANLSNEILGWIPSIYINPSDQCPTNF